MSLVKKIVPSNGTGKNATTPLTGSEETLTTTPPASQLKPFDLGGIGNISPLEDRILKVQKLADLVEKRERYADSLRKLQSISQSTEGRNVKITIEDSKTEWSTHNMPSIRECILSLVDTHKKIIADLDAQICW
jgi:hypothetical protein